MVRLVNIVLFVFVLASCSDKAIVTTKATNGPFNVGDCIHIGSDILKVTVVGNESYAFMLMNTKAKLDKDNFHTLPKVDVHEKGIKTDCWDEMKKQHERLFKTK